MASYQRQSAMTPPLTSPAAAASHQPRTKASLGLRERLDLRDLDRESEDDFGARHERTSRGADRGKAADRQARATQECAAIDGFLADLGQDTCPLGASRNPVGLFPKHFHSPPCALVSWAGCLCFRQSVGPIATSCGRSG